MGRDETRQGLVDVEKRKQREGGREGGRLVCAGGGGRGRVRVEISKEEMRIQKGGHHSDSHLFSFSPSHTCMHARAHAHAPSVPGPSQYFSCNKASVSAA